MLVMLAGLAAMAAAPAGSIQNPEESAIKVWVVPAEVLIEKGDLKQLNFDFRVDNRSTRAIDLNSIEMSVFDDRGRLILKRDVDGSGASPAIQTVLPDRHFNPSSQGIFFNPFTTFANDFPLNELRYRLTFSESGGPSIERELIIRPREWKPMTALVLPLDGRVWVKHGHDYLSHHRRWNPLHPIAQSFGATATFARYGLDLMIVDKEGRTRKGTGERNDDFYGWGAPVRAPGKGKVVAAYDKDADDDLSSGKSGFDPERLPKEPLHFYGNYVIIDHGNGEFSLLGHLQHGSVRVRLGDRVGPGQVVAKVGTSGSAEFEPHLHYELRRGATMAVEGLPAYFNHFIRLRGDARVAVKQGPINSGEFVSAAQ